MAPTQCSAICMVWALCVCWLVGECCNRVCERVRGVWGVAPAVSVGFVCGNLEFHTHVRAWQAKSCPAWLCNLEKSPGFLKLSHGLDSNYIGVFSASTPQVVTKTNSGSSSKRCGLAWLVMWLWLWLWRGLWLWLWQWPRLWLWLRF